MCAANGQAPLVSPWPAAGSADVVRCAAVVTFHQCIVGVMLPVLVAGFTAPSTGRLPPAEQPQAGAPGAQPLGGCWVWRAAAAVGTGVVRLDAALAACCRGTGLAALQLFLACWLLAGSCWALAKGAALRAAAGGAAGTAAGTAAKC